MRFRVKSRKQACFNYPRKEGSFIFSKRESAGDKIFLLCVYIFVFLIFTIVLYPLVLVLSSSISDPVFVATGKVWFFPKGLTLMGYEKVFRDSLIMVGYRNTIFYTLTGTALSLIITVPAGYALSKSELPGRGFFTLLFLFIMYFSGGMIPSFLLVKSLGLYNTRTVLIILGAFSSYNCIICRTFFSTLPQELEDAAEIDGCSQLRAFIQVALPISQALIGVMTLWFAVAYWNSYFTAMMYTMDEKITTLQLVLRRILVQSLTQHDMMYEQNQEMIAEWLAMRELIKYAVIVVSSLPLLLLYPFLQKYFVKGVMIGSLKG